MRDRIMGQATLLGVVFALGMVAGVGHVLGDDGAQPSSAQSGAADGMCVELLDGTRITGVANVEQLAVETASGIVKVSVANLVSFTPGIESRPELSKRVEALIAALASGSFAERERAQRELTEMGPMLKPIVAAYANDADAERQHRVAQILKAYETWALGHPGAPKSSMLPIQRRDQVQTSSSKHVGRIAQRQFRLETDYGTFKFELSQVSQATKIPIAPARRQDKRNYPVVIELRNGSLVKGDLGEPNTPIQVEGPYGKASIPVSLLRTIAVQDDRKMIDLMLNNGDHLKGRLDGLKQLELKTAGARLILPDETVRISLCGAAIVPSKGLVLHLPLDEKMEKVRDQSGKGNHGTICEAQYAHQGRFGGAYVLDGENDHIEIPNSESLEIRKELTLAVWITLASFGPGGYANEHGYIFNKGDDLWWNPAFCLGYNKGSGAGAPRWPANPGPFTALFHVCNETGGQNGGGKTVTSKTALEAGKWYHLAGTYDGTRLKIYVNGKLEAEEAYTGLLRSDHAPIHLGGGKLSGTDWGNQFTANGTIDEVAIWDRALSADEILRVYEQ